MSNLRNELLRAKTLLEWITTRDSSHSYSTNINLGDVLNTVNKILAHQELMIDKDVDDIISELYFRFDHWGKRGFSTNDLTWDEIRVYVVGLIDKRINKQNVRRLTFDEVNDLWLKQYGLRFESLPDLHKFADAIMDACGIPKEGKQ